MQLSDASETVEGGRGTCRVKVSGRVISACLSIRLRHWQEKEKRASSAKPRSAPWQHSKPNSMSISNSSTANLPSGQATSTHLSHPLECARPHQGTLFHNNLIFLLRNTTRLLCRTTSASCSCFLRPSPDNHSPSITIAHHDPLPSCRRPYIHWTRRTTNMR